MNRKIVYELDAYEIRKALAEHYGVKIEAVNLSAKTSVMGYEIEAPIKVEIEYKF